MSKPVDDVADPVLRVEGVSHHYGQQPVLRGVSFSLGAGQRLALMGPSGSGKSTLLNCLGGIEQPVEGRILLDGRDITRLDETARADLRRRDVATVFQFFHLLPTLSARENVEVPLRLLGGGGSALRQQVQSLLEEVGVALRADALPTQLSGGERQRVAIARALATRPKLLLADEPTGNLDTATGERILDLLETASARHGIALILVTHQPETTRICGRTLHLRDGLLEPAA